MIVMKKSLLALGISALSCFGSVAFGQVTQEIQVHTKVLPGTDKYSSSIVVVLDKTSMLEDEAASKAYDRVKSQFQTLLQKLGEVKVGPETGFGRESFQVNRTTLAPDLNLIEGKELASKIKKLYTTFLPEQNSFQNIYFPGGVPYIEMSFAESDEISKFLNCVLLDYQANVSGAIKLPTYLKNAMSTKCAGRISPAELSTFMLVFDDTIQHTVMGSPIDWKSERQYFSPHLLEEDIASCNSQGPTTLAQVVEAGWSKPADATVVLKACLTTVYNQFFALNDLLKNGFRASVVSNKQITPYYRSLLNALLEAKDKDFAPNIALLENSIKDDLKRLASLQDGYTQNSLSMSDFDLIGFNQAVKDKTKNPDQVLAALFSKPKGPESAIRKEMALSPELSQMAYLGKVKDFMAKTCDFDKFNVSCLREGLANLESNQAQLEFTFGLENQSVWSGYLFFEPSSTSL
jgi:hypothetical protein